MRGAIPHVLFVSLALLCGCQSFGQRALQRNHLAYNDAVSATEMRELLLNVVRLRYADPIKFLSVDHITTSFTVEGGADAAAGRSGGDSNALFAPSVRFSDTPTITFTPQGDATFAENLLSPSSLAHVALTLDAMPDMENGLRLLVKEINGARDRPGEAGEPFRDYARRLGQLRDADRIGFAVVHKRDALGIPLDKSTLTHSDVLAAVQAGYTFQEAPDGKVVLVGTRRVPGLVVRDDQDGQTHEHLAALGIDLAETVVDLRSTAEIGADKPSGKAVYISPRSVLSMMAVLARGVEVPPEHQCAGLVPPPSAFPGSGGPGALIWIHSGTSRPSASLSVRHRDHWYWIDDADILSKESFANLVAFYTLRLKAQTSESGRPVLTLPVGGG